MDRSRQRRPEGPMPERYYHTGRSPALVGNSPRPCRCPCRHAARSTPLALHLWRLKPHMGIHTAVTRSRFQHHNMWRAGSTERTQKAKITGNIIRTERRRRNPHNTSHLLLLGNRRCTARNTGILCSQHDTYTRLQQQSRTLPTGIYQKRTA